MLAHPPAITVEGQQRFGALMKEARYAVSTGAAADGLSPPSQSLDPANG
jgi:hypothetical protein